MRARACSQEWDALEGCAGSGRLTRILRFAGFQVASLDLKMWDPAQHPRVQSQHNPLDMLEPSGMAFPGPTHVLQLLEVEPCIASK